MEKETINDRIRQIIEKEGHTISSFAKRIKIGDQTIRSIANDRNKPSYDILVKIIKSFEWVDANWLVMGETTKKEDLEKRAYYALLESQQKTKNDQQETINRLTEKLLNNLSPDNKKTATAG